MAVRHRRRVRRVVARIARAPAAAVGVSGHVQAGAFKTPPAAKTSGNPPDHSAKVQFSGKRLSEAGQSLKGGSSGLRAIRATGLKLRR